MANAYYVPTAVGLCLALIGPAAIAGLSGRTPHCLDRLNFHLFAQFGLLTLAASVLLIALLWERQPLSSMGLHPLRWQSFIWGIALALFFIYVFAPAAHRTLQHFGISGFDRGLKSLAGLPVWYLFIAVLIGGFSEELLYRGYAIERLSSLTGSYWLGGLISLLAFGLAHVPMWGWGPALTTFVSGGILTLFYIWQQDLLANILTHVITDFVGIVLMPLLGRAGGK